MSSFALTREKSVYGFEGGGSKSGEYGICLRFKRVSDLL